MRDTLNPVCGYARVRTFRGNHTDLYDTLTETQHGIAHGTTIQDHSDSGSLDSVASQPG